MVPDHDSTLRHQKLKNVLHACRWGAPNPPPAQSGRTLVTPWMVYMTPYLKHRHAVHAEPVTFVFLPCHKCAQLVPFVCK